MPGASGNLVAFLHFATTSEDINNLAYALMLRDARQRVLLPLMKQLTVELRTLAHRFADVPMLARTHGQPATPTTLGKELANFVYRLERQAELFGGRRDLRQVQRRRRQFQRPCGRLSGRRLAGDHGPVSRIARRSTPTRYSTQIEPHDWIAEYCQALGRFNTVCIDLCRDLLGLHQSRLLPFAAVAGEVGSSTMPHKVNPIEFENAEGNLGVANELLGFSRASCRSRAGSATSRIRPCCAIWRRARPYAGRARFVPARARQARRGSGSCIAADLDERWEVLAEAVQTVMRRHGLADAYEQLKELTRGREIDRAALREFIARPRDPAGRARAPAGRSTPSSYTGLAARLRTQRLTLRPAIRCTRLAFRQNVTCGTAAMGR